MYCKRICGDPDFDIDEYNKAMEEIKTLTPEQQDYVLQIVPNCVSQCNRCKQLVKEQREKTKKLIGKMKNKLGGNVSKK